MRQIPYIVVIVPARNEAQYILPTLYAIKEQNYGRMDIVVVDSDSSDNTAILASNLTPHIVRVHEKGVARARNAGARYAIELHADILVFIDADTLMGPCVLDSIASAVIDKNKMAGSCQIKLDKRHFRARITTTILNLLQRFHRSPHSLMFCTPAVFENIPFDESMVMAEDEKWAYSIMKKFGMFKYYLITNAVVITSARRFEKYGYWNILYKWWTNLPFSLSTQDKETSYFE